MASSTDTRALGQSLPPAAARVDALAWPSPTTTYALLLAVALFSAGLYAGNWVHNEVFAADWARRTTECFGRAPRTDGTPESFSALQEMLEVCRRGVEQRRGAVGLAGGVAAAAVAGVIVALAPVVIRRRRRLVPARERFGAACDRVAELGRSMGLREDPEVLVGPVGRGAVTDAFCIGRPGAHALVLPTPLALKGTRLPVFDAIVRHELSHIRHNDVGLAWLATSMRYAVIPLLAIPVVSTLLRGQYAMAADLAWRAGLLLLIATLASRAFLRSREYDADLRSVSPPGTAASPVTADLRVDGDGGSADRREQLLAALGAARAGSRPAWRRPLAFHPPARARLAVLERPEIAARLPVTTAFSAALMAALALPIVEAMLAALLWGSDPRALATALTFGPLLGGTVGLGLWREAAVRRFTGDRPDVVRPALATGFGLATGSLVSVQWGGMGNVVQQWDPALLLARAVALTGAAVVSAGLAAVVVDALPRLRSARTGWVAGVLLTGCVFTVALLWVQIVGVVMGTASAEGLQLLLMTAVFGLSAPEELFTLVTCVALAVVSAWATATSRSSGRSPAWLCESSAHVVWEVLPGRQRALAVAASTALAALGAAGIYLRIAGEPPTQETFLDVYGSSLVLAAAVAVIASLLLAAWEPRRGLGLALAAGPLVGVTATLATVVALAQVPLVSMSQSLALWSVSQVLGLWLAALVVVAPLTLLGHGRSGFGRGLHRVLMLLVAGGLAVGLLLWLG